jgi:hypothetical protein
MVKWPGIIKYLCDVELTYVNDQSEWDNDADLHSLNYDESDYLIDSTGNLYTLTNRNNGYVKPEENGSAMSLGEILELIKAYAAQIGECCVSKMYAPSINDAFKIVASLNDK